MATVVVALAIGLAAWALVRTVEHQLVDKVQAQGEARVAEVVRQLESGVSPKSILPVGQGSSFVQVVDARGDVLGGSPAFGSTSPIMFVTRVPGPGESGGVQVDVPDPTGANEVPLDVRYQSGITTSAGPVTVVAASPLGGVEESIATLKHALMFGIPFLVVLVALIAWLVVGRALRPVESIRAEVEAISESTMHRRVPEPGTGDEVDRLARTMNAMLDRLETSSQRQRRFVADASHELRSPIAAMRTQLEVALQPAGTESVEWPVVATNVLVEEQRLEELVTDLLLLASIDEQPGPTNDAVALTSLREVAAAQARRSRRVAVELSDGEDVAVAVRRDLVDRVIANLVDNAARHARSGVRVIVSRRDDTARLVVDDDGPGIPESERQRVFERFARLDDARARDAGGAGLGLSLARAIAERHHGGVAIDDAPLGGARLIVELPIGKFPS
jgi:signal transduction histidine kinase